MADTIMVRGAGMERLDEKARTLGADHPDTLAAAHDIGTEYFNLRAYDEALKLLQQALPGAERVLSMGHPKALTTVHSIAWCLPVKEDLMRRWGTLIGRFPDANGSWARTTCARYTLSVTWRHCSLTTKGTVMHGSIISEYYPGWSDPYVSTIRRNSALSAVRL
jgi:hypothetical protein